MNVPTINEVLANKGSQVYYSPLTEELFTVDGPPRAIRIIITVNGKEMLLTTLAYIGDL